MNILRNLRWGACLGAAATLLSLAQVPSASAAASLAAAAAPRSGAVVAAPLGASAAIGLTASPAPALTAPLPDGVRLPDISLPAGLPSPTSLETKVRAMEADPSAAAASLSAAFAQDVRPSLPSARTGPRIFRPSPAQGVDSPIIGEVGADFTAFLGGRPGRAIATADAPELSRLFDGTFGRAALAPVEPPTTGARTPRTRLDRPSSPGAAREDILPFYRKFHIAYAYEQAGEARERRFAFYDAAMSALATLGVTVAAAAGVGLPVANTAIWFATFLSIGVLGWAGVTENNEGILHPAAVIIATGLAVFVLGAMSPAAGLVAAWTAAGAAVGAVFAAFRNAFRNARRPAERSAVFRGTLTGAGIGLLLGAAAWLIPFTSLVATIPALGAVASAAWLGMETGALVLGALTAWWAFLEMRAENPHIGPGTLLRTTVAVWAMGAGVGAALGGVLGAIVGLL